MFSAPTSFFFFIESINVVWVDTESSKNIYAQHVYKAENNQFWQDVTTKINESSEDPNVDFRTILFQEYGNYIISNKFTKLH